MRQHSQELARALAEQSRGMREMTGASGEVALNINLISAANQEQSANAAHILQMLSDARSVADRNLQGVQLTVSETTGLLEQALEVTSILENYDSRPETAQQG
jgi:methyl-accepting chemotaxis protein